jgi:hypothetical protein
MKDKSCIIMKTISIVKVIVEAKKVIIELIQNLQKTL